MTLEKLAENIFAECEKEGEPVTMEEAMEMAKMEAGAKTISHNAKSETTVKKDKKPKTIIVSAEKIALFDLIWEGLSNFYGESAEITRANKEISVKIGEKSFKIDVVEHRNKKK